MNSGIMDEVFMSPVAAHQAALQFAQTQEIFKDAVAASILTAVTAGLFTASTAVGSTPSQDVQYVLALLNQAGYQASVTGTNLVANW
jgi:hypothetical protein